MQTIHFVLLYRMDYLKEFDTVDNSTNYALYRPTYPKALLNMILTFVSKNNGSGLNVVVDVGCGSGQSTFFLCDHFKTVIGVDASAAQIANAQKKITQMLPENKYQNIEFKVGNAYNLPVESSSADIITCASCWHWLNPDVFYKEVNRVLKPNGVLAIYGYCANTDLSVGDYHCQKMFTDFIHRMKEAGFWHERFTHCEEKYSAVNLPLNFAATERHEFSMPWNTTLDDFIGYLSTILVYRDFKQRFPDATPLLDAKTNYQKAKGEVENNPHITFMFSAFMIIGKKKE